MYYFIGCIILSTAVNYAAVIFTLSACSFELWLEQSKHLSVNVLQQDSLEILRRTRWGHTINGSYNLLNLLSSRNVVSETRQFNIALVHLSFCWLNIRSYWFKVRTLKIWKYIEKRRQILKKRKSLKYLKVSTIYYHMLNTLN